MRRWVSSASYKRAVAVVVEARHASGKTQRQLAEALGKPASFVAKIETGERRLDFVEFIAIARALGTDGETLMARVSAAVGDQLDF